MLSDLKDELSRGNYDKNDEFVWLSITGGKPLAGVFTKEEIYGTFGKKS